MKNLHLTLYNFALQFIRYFSLCLAAVFFICGFFFTAYATDMSSQNMLIRTDNLLLTVPCSLLMLFFIILVYKWVSNSPDSRNKILLFIVLGWYMIAGLFLVLFSKTAPAGDPMSVYSAAAELAGGNLGVIHPTDSYLSYYPQQVGLVAYYELILRLWNLVPVDLHAYHIIKCINILWACIMILFLYKSVQLLFKSRTSDTVFLLLSLLHFPLLFYTSYVYGEIPSFALFSVGAWALLRLLLSEVSLSCRRKTVLTLICILSFCASVALRKNALILIIAVFIVTFLEAVKQKKPLLLLLALLSLCLSLATLPCIQSVYELRAHNTLSSGVPAMSYFAMGMQEGGRGPGWYNHFNFATYAESGLDHNLAVAQSRDAISERLTYFKEHPLYTCQFYAGKLLTQWSDGTYASLQATLADFGGRSSFFTGLYAGTGAYTNFYYQYCNILQNLIYLGVLLFTIGSIKKKTSVSQGLPIYLFMIGIVGGFLFHFLWEANSRYILVYGLLLLPYAARGIGLLLSHMEDDLTKAS